MDIKKIFSDNKRNKLKDNKNNYIEQIIQSVELLTGIAKSELASNNNVDFVESISYLTDYFIELIPIDISTEKLSELNNYTIIKKPSIGLKNNSKDFFTSFVDSYYEIWKTAYLNEDFVLTSLIIDKLESILGTYLWKMEFRNVTTPILNVLNRITLYGSKNPTKEIDISIYRASFGWYDLALKNLQLSDESDLFLNDADVLLKGYNRFLWLNFKYMVDNKNHECIANFVRNWFHSRFYDDFYNNIGLTFEFKQLNEKHQELKYKLQSLQNFNNYKEWLKDYNILCDMLERAFGTSEYISKLRHFRSFKQNALGYIINNNIQEFLVNGAAYCLFKKDLFFIKYLWEYTQPKDSGSINFVNEIIPNDLYKIIKMFIEDSRITSPDFYLVDNHDISSYLKRYACLLFLRQYTLPMIYYYENPLRIDHIPKMLDKIQLSYWYQELDNLSKWIEFVQKDADLIKELNLKTEFEEGIVPPVCLISNLKDYIKKQEDYILQTEQIEPWIVEKCQKDIKEFFDSNNIFFQILLDENKFKVETIENQSLMPKFEIKRIDIKSPFSINSNAVNFGLGSSYGEILTHKVSEFFYSKYTTYCNSIGNQKLVDVDDLITNINRSFRKNEKYVIVSFNLQLEKSILANNSDFISSGIQNERKGALMVGTYKEHPMYSVYQGGFPSAIFVLNKKSLGVMKVFNSEQPPEIDTFGKEDYIYFSIKDLADEKNKDIHEEYKKRELSNSNLSEKEIENYLRKNVEIKLKIYYEFEEPSSTDFDGELFIVKH